MYFNYLQDIYNETFFNNKLLIKFTEILLMNISPNPHKRYTIDETNNYCKELFNIGDNVDTIQEYLTFIEKFDA